MQITFTISEADLDRLTAKITEKAMELEDDGREGNPDAKIIWNVVGQLREAVRAKKTIGVEAYGVKGMKSTPWRKTFKNMEKMLVWAERNSAQITSTRVQPRWANEN